MFGVCNSSELTKCYSKKHISEITLKERDILPRNNPVSNTIVFAVAEVCLTLYYWDNKSLCLNNISAVTLHLVSNYSFCKTQSNEHELCYD